MSRMLKPVGRFKNVLLGGYQPSKGIHWDYPITQWGRRRWWQGGRRRRNKSISFRSCISGEKTHQAPLWQNNFTLKLPVNFCWRIICMRIFRIKFIQLFMWELFILAANLCIHYLRILFTLVCKSFLCFQLVHVHDWKTAPLHVCCDIVSDS